MQYVARPEKTGWLYTRRLKKCLNIFIATYGTYITLPLHIVAM